MKRQLKTVQKSFTASIIGLVACTILVFSGSLFVQNIGTYNQQVSEKHIQELVQGHPAVAAYIQSQQKASPHFVALTTIVKQEQQRKIAYTILFISLPLLMVSMLAGRLLAKKLLKPVADSYAAQERFIQDAAHELRNPLAAMSASIEAAQLQTSPTKKDYLSLLQKMERQTKRLIYINEDLLFLQRTTESYKDKTNISTITTTVIQELSVAAKERNIAITDAVTADLQIVIRPKDYEIIVRNLLDNAIKYSPDSSNIHIRLGKNKTYVTLTVTDHGMGVPKNEVHLVTKRFYRASNTGTIAGSGLGLALVQKVVDSYGGIFTFTSKPTKGTVCTVLFTR